MDTFQKIVHNSKPVLIDFFAEWCGPCKMMPPILSQLKEKMGDSIRILKIDVDKNPNMADRYQVRGVPTLVLMQKGKIVWRESGIIDVNTLHQHIKNKL